MKNADKGKISQHISNFSIRKVCDQQKADAEPPITAEEVNVLLNELHIYQLELEMQNDELKSSHLLLDQQRAKFVGLFELAPVGYFILDYLGVVEEANQNGVDMLNITKKVILGRRFQSFIVPFCWEDFYAFLYRIQHSDSKQSVEVKLALPHDQVLYVRMEGAAVPGILLTEIKYYITVIDITVSRKAEKTLRDTKDRLEMTLKASATGTWTIKCLEENVFLDSHSLNILGISNQDFDGTMKGLVGLVHPDDQLKVAHQLVSINEGLKDVDLEFRVFNAHEIKYIAAKGHEIKTLDENTYFAGILMDITERKRLQQEAETLKNDQQMMILAATLNAQERERSSISRALHDSICQILYGIRLNLESIQQRYPLRHEFKNVNHLINLAIEETRQLSYELTPTVLMDFGFVIGLKEMTDRLITPEFNIDTRIDEEADFLPKDVQLNVFRMAQELVNNCIKHAKATYVEVRVRMKGQQVTISVADNGIGMNEAVEQASKRPSGLSGIRNRVYLLNGQLKLTNTKKGLTVTIIFNLEPDQKA